MRLNLGLNLGIINQLNQAILDQLSVTSSVAYSLRKIRSAYTGNAIRVRRSSDNAEQDIGFVNSELDTTALTGFVGGENLLSRSEEFDNASWVKTNVTVTSEAVTAPDGTMTADVIVEQATNTAHRIFTSSSPSIVPDIPYTWSAYIHTSSTRRYVMVGGTGTNAIYAVFDTVTQTITYSAASGGVVIASGVENVGGGWYRLWITGTYKVTTTLLTIVGSDIPNPASIAPPYLGDGSTIVCWGAQLNEGDLKPYQPTTTTVRDGNGFITTWYDQSGNGRHATQTVVVRQPSIVTAGVVRVDGAGKPQVYFDGISHAMNGPVYTAGAPITQNFVFDPSATQVAYAMPLITRRAVHEFRKNGYISQWTQLVNSSVSMIDSTTGFGVPRVSTTLFGTTQSDLYANGSLVATAVAATGNVISDLTIGNRSSGDPYQYRGGMGEIIFFPSVLSTTDRQTLERNQGTFYGITVT